MNMKQKSFHDLREHGSRLTKRSRKQKVLPKLSIPRHEFDMILIDLSKSLHVGGGKMNDKRKTAVANDKVAIILKAHLTLTFIHLLSQVGVNFLACHEKLNDGK